MTRDELRAVLPGGVHHEVAKAWAASDEAVLQSRPPFSCFWTNGDAQSSWSLSSEYRIKPKTLRYRVAKFVDGYSKPYLTFALAPVVEGGFERHPQFLEWASDWIEVEL